MVAKNDILIAKENIEKVLWDFVEHKSSAKIYIFYTDWGHLCALIGSHGFQGMNITDRLDEVWDYLRQHVSQDDLKHLHQVDPMDRDEYDARTWEVRTDNIDSE